MHACKVSFKRIAANFMWVFGYGWRPIYTFNKLTALYLFWVVECLKYIIILYKQSNRSEDCAKRQIGGQ